MKIYIRLIRRSFPFTATALILILVASAFLFSYSVSEIHLGVNSVHNGFLDWIMPWVTDAGDGITITIAILLMFAWKRSAALVTGVSCLLASGVTQLLKHTIFMGEPRPVWYFQHREPAQLYLVPGVENFLYDSFPSGHTTLAFAFFFSLAMLIQKHFWQVAFVLFASLIGYSRMYLSQHFLADVTAGAVIGILVTLMVFAESERRNLIHLPLMK